MKYRIHLSGLAEDGLFPYGKSGLKCSDGQRRNRRTGSLPVWEEWIEIPPSSALSCRRPRLFPYGKSGLKFIVFQPFGTDVRLFPYGKSGLKSSLAERSRCHHASLPVWEEWIEISGITTVVSPPNCLFPYGKSGLKSQRKPRLLWPRAVSSRMGRVD